jgi:hypothetical protein
MKDSVIFTTVWADESLLELQVSAHSSEFFGRVNLYSGIHEVRDLAKVLQDFPVGKGDSRQYCLGAPVDKFYGAATAKFTCIDDTGHCEVMVSLVAGKGNVSSSEAVTVIIRIVPSDIDRFVAQLNRMTEEIGQDAVLSNAA